MKFPFGAHGLFSGANSDLGSHYGYIYIMRVCSLDISTYTLKSTLLRTNISRIEKVFCVDDFLGDGFKYFLFSPILGNDSHFD